MRVIKCEMCGGTDIIKEAGVYVCQSCGIKYSLEEAKKMMVEVQGTVDVRGSVKVENSASIDSLIKRAFMLIEVRDYNKARELLDQTLNIDPECAKAYVGQLLCELELNQESLLATESRDYQEDKLFERAVKFADAEYADQLEKYAELAKQERAKSDYFEKAIFSGYTKDGIKYEKGKDGYIIVGHKKVVSSKIILGRINGINITGIGDHAFDGCTGLTSIEIPDSVTSIGKGAFFGCTGLTSITLPFVGSTKDGTENTHFGYIFGAGDPDDNKSSVPSSLKTVVITGGRSIGNSAFWGCKGLTSIVIPDSVKSIDCWAFEGCTGLRNYFQSRGLCQYCAGKLTGIFTKTCKRCGRKQEKH